jgi:hypothetical protein
MIIMGKFLKRILRKRNPFPSFHLLQHQRKIFLMDFHKTPQILTYHVDKGLSFINFIVSHLVSHPSSSWLKLKGKSFEA